ncbi:C1q-binding complement inhibitor VraX [Staphylococcus hominis]|uniref:C1q-binding complement inhibitor VraX n=1 Tax=Staphylococcus hominis TaxID=1290 RepID=UPI000E047F3A|nr:C1q-binding complement inhibitor VraX [Staphylococcus hominis]SUM74161.1 protein vraX [Staphylococcus hominis]
MIIYKQNIENSIPIYEIITKTFKTITVKFDETFSKTDIYPLLSLPESDVDNMKLSYSSHFKT